MSKQRIYRKNTGYFILVANIATICGKYNCFFIFGGLPEGMSSENTNLSTVQNQSNETKDSPFVHWLQNELTQRCRKNSKYSLRAFAKTLQVDASTLSQILSGKRKLTKKSIQKFCVNLNIPIDVETYFLQEHETKEKSASPTSPYSPVYIDSFNAIADWYHTVILEMTEQKDFLSDPFYIANQLGISQSEAKLAIERLIRLGLLIEKNGVLKKVNKQLSNFKPGETSRAHRLFQKQIIAKASDAIENTASELKDITAMIMSIDEKKLPEARVKIQKFRHEMCEFLEDGDVSQVYSLSIQLVPMQNRKDHYEK